MDSTSKVQVRRTNQPGSFFGVGGDNQVGQWQGEHGPEVKRNWERERTAKSTDELYREKQDQRSTVENIQAQREKAEKQIERRHRQSADGQYFRSQVAAGSEGLRRYSNSLSAQGKKKRATAARYAAARVKVTTANAWVNSWVMFWYITFQLPMAIVSAAAFGMTYAVYEAIEGLVGETLTNAAIQTLIEAQGITAGVIEAVAKWIFRIDFDPILLFILPFALLMMFGFLQLILCWFIYSALGIKSLSGKSAGAKCLLFMFAGIGTAVPIINLFPLILLWTGLVWFRPR